MKWLAPFTAFILLACASEQSRVEHADAVRKASLASGICTLHHVALQRTVVYGYSHFDVAILDPSVAEHRAALKYPLSLDYFQRRRPSPDFHNREVAVYCPVCQQRFEQETHR